MRGSDWLNGSSETENNDKDPEKFEFEHDNQATVVKGRLALGFLVAGAFSLLKDVLVTVNSYASPLFPNERTKADDGYRSAGGEGIDAMEEGAANVARSQNGQNRDASSDSKSGGSASSSHLNEAAVPADFGAVATAKLSTMPVAGFADNVVEFPTESGAPSAAAEGQAGGSGQSGAAPASGNTEEGSVAPLPPVAGNDNDFDFPDTRGDDTDSGGDATDLPVNDIEVGTVIGDIEDPFDPDPEAEDGSGQIRNRAPIVSNPVRLDGLLVNQSVIIGLTSFLAHASDPDGDALSIRELSVSSGQLVNNGDGTWTFTPATDDVSDVVFSYTVSDGEAGTAQTAYMDLLPAEPNLICGTDGDDILIGTPGEDFIDAKDGDDIVLGDAGNDTIIGGEGDDTIDGGAGDDLIFAGGGDDVVLAGDGDDSVFAGAGDDFVSGGRGNDTIFGDDGDDLLFGDEGNDAVYGNAGDDTVDGGAGDDVVVAGAGNDHAEGGAGSDYVDGGEGDDVVSGGAGEDNVDGGSGDDLIVATKFDGNDRYDGGTGVDTYDLSGTGAAAVVDLAAETASSAETGTDGLTNVENVIGTVAGDKLTGDEGSNELSGEGGDDDISGGAGEDDVDGGSGDDLIVATKFDGNDRYDGGTGVDTYDLSGTGAAAVVDLAAETASSAETGTDKVTNIENVIGTVAGDKLTGDEGDNELSGEDGDDDISGGAGEDVIDAGAGDDRAVGGHGDDYIDGGDGDDVIYGGHDPNQAVDHNENEHHTDHSDHSDGDSDGEVEDEQETAVQAAPEQEETAQLGNENGNGNSNGNETAAEVPTGTVVEILDQNTEAVAAAEASATTDEEVAQQPQEVAPNNTTVAAVDPDLIPDPDPDLSPSPDPDPGIVAASSNDAGDSDDDHDDDDDDHDDDDHHHHHNDGDDIIKGGRGNDIIEGGSGHDEIDGEEDDDRFYASVDDGDDDYVGGEGSDTYDLSHTKAGAKVDLLNGTATSDDTGHDTLDSVENVVGTENDDEIVASAARNILTGNGGDDVFVFEKLEDMGVGGHNRDFITDFNIGDKIDLSELNSHSGDDDDDQTLELLHNAGQELEVGQISYRHVYFEEEKRTIIEGNVEGGTDIDFELEVAGHFDFTKDNFDGVG